MDVSLDDPIEDLKLSSRTRNALRRMGCATLGSLLNHEAGPASRRSGYGFGPVSQAEVARALAANGLTSWAELMPAETNGERLAALRNAAESERARPHGSRSAAKQYAELAEEFKSPLTVICTASAGLLQTKTLSPEQRELAELVEIESVRLRELLHVLLDTSRVKTRRTGPIE
jgi:signal transduction histidine kinase